MTTRPPKKPKTKKNAAEPAPWYQNIRGKGGARGAKPDNTSGKKASSKPWMTK